MKVLHIDTGNEMRGGQYQVLLLLKSLRDAGHRVSLLAKRGAPLLEKAKSVGFAVQSATFINIWKESPAYDILHAHDARAHSFASLASRRKFVVSRRVAFPIPNVAVSRWKYRQPARYLAISQAVAKELFKAGVEPRKVDIVYDAVEPTPPRDPSIPADRIVALSTSDPLKGRDLIEQASLRSGLPVVFSTDLPRDFERASMFVYISRAEGLGSAALLAMQMGVPVIASRIGGLPELIEHGVTGLLTENDAGEIAAAMERLNSDEELTAKLVSGASEKVNRQFSPRALVEGTLAAYQRALDS